MIANVGLSIDLMVDAVVLGDAKLSSDLMASQNPSLISTIWVLMAQDS